MKFTAIVPVRPNVELNDYRAIRLEREPADVTPEMIDEQLQLLRRRHATHVPVEREVKWDDILIADVTGESVDDAPNDDKGDNEHIVEHSTRSWSTAPIRRRPPPTASASSLPSRTR